MDASEPLARKVQRTWKISESQEEGGQWNPLMRHVYAALRIANVYVRICVLDKGWKFENTEFKPLSWTASNRALVLTVLDCLAGRWKWHVESGTALPAALN